MQRIEQPADITVFTDPLATDRGKKEVGVFQVTQEASL